MKDSANISHSLGYGSQSLDQCNDGLSNVLTVIVIIQLKEMQSSAILKVAEIFQAFFEQT